MARKALQGWVGGTGLFLVLLGAGPVAGQTYTSGSTGALGALAPTASTTITLPPDGVLNYTTVTIPSGVTVTFARNATNTPVTLLATGDVTITGTLSVNGIDGAFNGSGNPPSPGGAGGPGGFAGGRGGFVNATQPPMGGLGPGGGGISGADGLGGTYNLSCNCFGLLPLFGGSGGGGGAGQPGLSGPSGGGGGGAIVIASSTKITVSGSITANGGTRGCVTDGFGNCTRGGGGGSGGAIRLVAPQITGGGTVNTTGGVGGGNGLTRMETFNFGFSGTTTPSSSVSFAPGPVTAASNPALINLPTLAITAVGGVAVPSTPTGSLTTTDVSLPSGTTNPVTVTLTVTNTPPSTTFTVILIPQNGGPTTVTSTASSGSFSSATATGSVTFPTGQVSQLQAFGSFSLPPPVAALFPLIDGEPVDRVMVAATYGEPSTVLLITRSGKEVRVDQLLPEEQVLVAKGFEAMQTR